MFEEQEEKVVETKEEEAKPKRSPYVSWKVGGKEYKLKLTTDGICQLEKTTKCNLLTLLDTIPALNVMCGIIHVSLQRYHHGISFKDVKVLVDEYIDEGGSQLELFTNVLLPLFEVSGFFSVEMGQTMSENVEMAKANI